jgi:hypothetical protein
LAISSLALIGALLSLFNGWQERSFLQHGKVELNVQRKNDRLTATVGEVILIFDWPTDVHHRSRSHMSLPVRGGSRTTIKMTRRTVHGRGETGPAGVNIIKINDYEFYLADHCRELCLPSPICGVRRFFLKSYKKPMTIVIAKDGTHRVKR